MTHVAQRLEKAGISSWRRAILSHQTRLMFCYHLRSWTYWKTLNYCEDILNSSEPCKPFIWRPLVWQCSNYFWSAVRIYKTLCSLTTWKMVSWKATVPDIFLSPTKRHFVQVLHNNEIISLHIIYVIPYRSIQYQFAGGVCSLSVFRGILCYLG